MTTLLLVAIILFGLAAYRGLPVSDLPNVDFPTISVTASLPGATPDTMASSVATPLEREFSTIAGTRRDDLDERARHHAASRCSSRSSRNIDAAAQDVQSAIAAAQRAAAAGHAVAAVVPEGESGGPADPLPGAELADAAAVVGRRIRRDATRAAHLDHQRRGAGAGVRRAEVRGARPARPARAGRARHRHRRSRRTRSPNANVNLPTGTLYGANQAFSVQANGQLTNAAAYRPLIVAYRNGSPVRLSDLGHVIDSVQNDKVAALVQRRARRWCSRSSGSRAPTPSRSSTRSSAAAALRAAAAGVGETRHAATTARDDPRSVHDVQFTLLLRVVPRRAGDLPVPAQRLGDAHPEPRAADVDHRHVRGDVRCSATASTTCR